MARDPTRSKKKGPDPALCGSDNLDELELHATYIIFYPSISVGKFVFSKYIRSTTKRCLWQIHYEMSVLHLLCIHIATTLVLLYYYISTAILQPLGWMTC